MNAVETLRALARGERPASGLLHAARLDASGAEAYGEEAIVERFRHAPIDLSPGAVVVEAPGHVAIFDGDVAVFADVFGQSIARLWCLGDGRPVVAEAGISVAFDPDLAQARGDVFFAASDHPALAPDAVDRVSAAGGVIARDDPTVFRARAFAIRAFGSASAGAALFAVYRLAGTAERTAGFAMAAARWSSGETQFVRDRAGESARAGRAWMPRIGV